MGKLNFSGFKNYTKLDVKVLNMVHNNCENIRRPLEGIKRLREIGFSDYDSIYYYLLYKENVYRLTDIYEWEPNSNNRKDLIIKNVDNIYNYILYFNLKDPKFDVQMFRMLNDYMIGDKKIGYNGAMHSDYLTNVIIYSVYKSSEVRAHQRYLGTLFVTAEINGDQLNIEFDSTSLSIPKKTITISIPFDKVDSNAHDLSIFFVNVLSLNNDLLQEIRDL